jgi:hypothetical protein
MSASKLIVRRTTREDIEDYSPLETNPSIRAMTFELDDYIIGMGGIARIQGRWLAFFSITDELRPYKITIARAAIRFFAHLRKEGVKFIYADRDPNEPTSERWLESLGFEIDPKSNYFYRWRA